MAEDLVTIGIALETAQVLAGTKQVQTAMQQLAQSEKQAQTATHQLQQSSTQAAQALGQERTAASGATHATESMEQAAQTAAKAMGQTLATAVSQAAQAMIQAQREANKAEDALRKAEQAAEEAARPFGAMGQKMLELGKQALAFGAAQVGVASLTQAFDHMRQSLTSTVAVAVKVEGLQAGFKAITGSAEGAQRQLGFVRQTADRLGMSFTDLGKAYQQLASAGQQAAIPATDIQTIFTAIVEKNRVLGNSLQDTSGAILAVTQSMSKGKVGAEEFNQQFAERMVGALGEAARAMGVTREKLLAMMEAGQLGLDLWAKWASTVRTDLAGATEEAAKSAGAAIGRLRSNFEQFQLAVGQFLLPGVASGVDALNRLASTALIAMEAMGKTVDTQKQFAAAQTQAAGDPGAAARQAEFARIQTRIRVMEQSRGMVAAGVPGALLEGSDEELAQLRARGAALLKEQQAINRALTGDEERRRDAARTLQQGEQRQRETDLKQRENFLAAVRKLLDEQKKAEADLALATRAGLGRAPDAPEKRKFLEDQLKKAQEFLLTNSKLAEQYKDDPVVKALRERGQATEAYGKQLDAAEKAEQQRKQAASKAETARKQAARDAEQQLKKDIDAAVKADEPFLQQVADAADLIGDLQRRTENLRYTEEERFQRRVQAMAEERPYLKEQLDAELARYEAAKKVNEALRERPRQLQEEATASKAKLDDINRIMQSLEPSKRTTTREEQFAAKRAELAALTDDAGKLAEADAKIRTALDTERWHDWRDAGLEAMDDLSARLTDFVFSGKASFAEMVTSMAQELFRLTSSQLFRGLFASDTGQGWMQWLMTAVNLGTKAAGATTGGGGTTTVDLAAAMHAQGGGLVQAGRPYWVGEAGPELVVPKQTSTVIPHGQSMALATPNVTVVVQGVTDAQSFLQSQGAIQRAITRTVGAAARAM